MSCRQLADGRIIEVSKRYTAICLFNEGYSVDHVTKVLGISRSNAFVYRRRARLQREAGNVDALPDDIIIRTRGLSEADKAALTDYLQNQCLPAFLAARVKSLP